MQLGKCNELLSKYVSECPSGYKEKHHVGSIDNDTNQLRKGKTQHWIKRKISLSYVAISNQQRTYGPADAIEEKIVTRVDASRIESSSWK